MYSVYMYTEYDVNVMNVPQANYMYTVRQQDWNEMSHEYRLHSYIVNVHVPGMKNFKSTE